MTDLIRLLMEIVQLLFPFRQVKPWEKGVFLAFGRYWRTVGPGVYPVIPWFTEVRNVSVVPAVWGTPLMTVTLGDGKALTYSAMATLEVVDPAAALAKVGEWPETSMETVSGLLGELLADETEDRFKSSYGRRAKLLKELLDKINAETLAFGVRVTALRFSNCVVNVRTFRLLMDRSTFSDATIGAV